MGSGELAGLGHSLFNVFGCVGEVSVMLVTISVAKCLDHIGMFEPLDTLSSDHVSLTRKQQSDIREIEVDVRSYGIFSSRPHSQ